MNDEQLMKQPTKKTKPEHLDLHSAAIGDEKRAELLRLFPEARTEGGKLDFDRLKLALGESVDVGKERYGMSWPGKADCFKTIQRPSLGTLRPAPKESVALATTENLIIEGDNLEVLKLLQKAYLGKVKMIYIDPPYNTGNDFIYPDDFSESLQTYLQYTGQADAEGKKFSTNADTGGRFHSRWLNMMYPRLYLARNLLRDDGVISVSIGDEEVANLLGLMNEVFGEENRIGVIPRVSKKTSNKGTHMAPSKDFLLLYARSIAALPPFMDVLDDDYVDRFDQSDDRGQYATVGLYQAALDPRPNQRYWVKCPDGSYVIPPGKVFPDDIRDASFVKPQTAADRVWRWSYESYLTKKNLLVFKRTKRSPLLTAERTPAKWNVYTKYYLEDRLRDGNRPRDFIEDVTNDQGTSDLKALGLDDVFPFPKPVELVRRQLAWLSTKDAICMDFFAGAGTTAEAVLKINREDGGKRRFILVQLPEPCEPDSAAWKNGFKTIADITKERVRRVCAKLEKSDAGQLDLTGKADLDHGFRVFKLDESNFKPWDADVLHDPEALKRQLELHVDHVRKARSSDDLLAEILLKSGFPLTVAVEEIDLAGKTVYSVADGALFVCLEDKLTLELIRAMADRKPERVVCLDLSFAGADQLKANAVQIFKTKGVTSFKTV